MPLTCGPATDHHFRCHCPGSFFRRKRGSSLKRKQQASRPSKRSAKILRGQVGTSQKKRLACTTKRTVAPRQGKSKGVRTYALWRRALRHPHIGHGLPTVSAQRAG